MLSLGAAKEDLSDIGLQTATCFGGWDAFVEELKELNTRHNRKKGQEDKGLRLVVAIPYNDTDAKVARLLQKYVFPKIYDHMEYPQKPGPGWELVRNHPFGHKMWKKGKLRYPLKIKKGEKIYMLFPTRSTARDIRIFGGMLRALDEYDTMSTRVLTIYKELISSGGHKPKGAFLAAYFICQLYQRVNKSTFSLNIVNTHAVLPSNGSIQEIWKVMYERGSTNTATRGWQNNPRNFTNLVDVFRDPGFTVGTPLKRQITMDDIKNISLYGKDALANLIDSDRVDNYIAKYKSEMMNGRG